MKTRILLASTIECDPVSEMLERAGYELFPAENGRKATQLLVSTPVSAIVLRHDTPFDEANDDARSLQTLDGLTDIDPFVPLLLICDPEVELDHPTLFMADMVLRNPVTEEALMDGLDILLSESFKERVLRKAGPVAGFR